MRKLICSAVCFGLILCTSLVVRAADEPSAPAAASSQPSLLQTPPGLSLLQPAQPPLPQATATRIGVVDLAKVSAESALGKKAQTQVKSQQVKLQKQVDTRKKQLDKFRSDTERQLPSLSPQQREAKQKEFQKKVEEFQKFGMKAEKELMEQQQKLTQGLFEAVGKAAEQLGKDKGVAAIVINRELLYLGAGVEPVDLTTELVQQLDAQTEKKK